MEEGKSALKILTGKPIGKRPLRKCNCRWEDSVRIDLKAIDVSTKNWIDFAQDRDYLIALVIAALNSRFRKPRS